MIEWIRRIREWSQRVSRRLAVWKLMRAVRVLRRRLQSLQLNLGGVTTRYKEVKADQPKNPNPQLLHQLEGDVEEFQQQVDRTQKRIEESERQLDELDPDGLIRASLPGE